jgi:hypothetical protein
MIAMQCSYEKVEGDTRAQIDIFSIDLTHGSQWHSQRDWEVNPQVFLTVPLTYVTIILLIN